LHYTLFGHCRSWLNGARLGGVAAAVDVEEADAVRGARGTYLDQLDTVTCLRTWRRPVGQPPAHPHRGVPRLPLGTLGAELAEIDDVARVVSDLPQQMPPAA
jgi:hypothetical protein